MQIRYLANAAFLITLADGRTILTDPWLEGSCQQTWRNFPPVPDALREEIYAAGADWLYISHLHHDHLHPRTLARISRDTPVLIGAMNTPNLKAAMARLGFTDILEVPFEQRTPLPGTGCDVVLFKDFHGNTVGDDSQVDYDLDTSIYVYDGDGGTLFNAVDNTILPEDAERIARDWGAPDTAILPYASASLYPMAMGDYAPSRKLDAARAIRARTAANFAANAEAVGARFVIPAGGEYVLAGPAAALSAYLPQPLASELAAVRGLRKLYPGDSFDDLTGAVTPDARTSHRDFDDAERLAYALTLADEPPSYTQTQWPDDLPPDWPRILRRCAANFHGRRQAMDLTLPMDVYLDIVSWPDGAPVMLFRLAMDCGASGPVPAIGAEARDHLVYRLDEKLLFSVVAGLLNWNALEASVLFEVRRSPDVYRHDLHRAMVYFTLLS